MEAVPVCRLGNRPRMLICYLCGREYGSKSLGFHIPQCQKKWLIEEEKRPKNERRALPPQPNAEKAIGSGGARAFESFNTEAYAAFEQTLEQCPNCQRRFLPKSFKTHQKGCTAAKPAKPAGTGLIKFSLTNRLVPGAIAGSTHGKAKKPPLPLRLCRPPPKAKHKLKSTQRPEWTGAGGSPSDEMEDNQLPLVRHKTSAQEWCLQAETNFSSRRGTNLHLHKNSQPGSRNSFQNRYGIVESAPGSVDEVKLGHGVAEAGGDNATLVTTFGEIWRTHSRANPNLSFPLPRRTHPNPKSSTSPAPRSEWFVPVAAAASSAPANPARQINSKSTRSSWSSQVQMPGSRQSSVVNALRSSHVERALDFVSLASKTSPVSKQRANGGTGTTLLQGATQDDLLKRHHHRRRPGFY